MATFVAIPASDPDSTEPVRIFQHDPTSTASLDAEQIGLTFGAQYQIGEVSDTLSEAFSPTNVPETMAAPTLTAGSTNISVERAPAPFNNGSVITRYDLRYRTGSGAWTEQAGISPTQAISGLTASTTYEAQTRAVNVDGVGSWSPSASATTLATGDTTAPTVSSISAGTQSGSNVPVTIVGLDEDSTLFFVLVPTGQAAPSAAQVVAGQNGSGGAASDEGSQFVEVGGGPYTLDIADGLDGTFDIHVAFRDAAGNVSVLYSDTGVAIDTTVQANSAPSAFTVGQWTASTGAGASQIDIDVLALPSDGGSAITALEYSTDNGTTWAAMTGTGTGLRTITQSSNGTVGTLTGGTTYNMRLRAVNANGDGPNSDVKATTAGSIGASPNLIFDTGFDDASKWVVPPGVSVTGSELVADGTNGSSALVSQLSGEYTALPSDASSYEFQFEVTRLVLGGSFRFQFQCFGGPGAGSGFIGDTIPNRLGGQTVAVNATGTYGPFTFAVPAGTTHVNARLQYITAGMDLDIDNVSILEV